jgi:PhnB protein
MSEAHKISRRWLIASGFSTATLAALPCRFTAGAPMQKNKGEEMNSFMPYLLFDGKCPQAMEFYKACFGGDLSVTKVQDSPAKDQMPAALHDKVVHARLKSGNIEIAASDWLMPNRTPIRGNTLCLFLSGGTLRELKSVFEKLSDGAEVTDPLKEQFFGTYGALNDKFGVRWMFQTTEKA